MQIGDPAPDFDLTADDGRTITLSEELVKGPVVLFFYPQALTYGCTRESCHFRDLAKEFGELGAQRLGISVDPVEKQKKFSEKHGFDYPLLSDPTRTAAAEYGVKRSDRHPNKRTTFVIDTDGTVLSILHSEMFFARHADEALDVLRARAAKLSEG